MPPAEQYQKENTFRPAVKKLVSPKPFIHYNSYSFAWKNTVFCRLLETNDNDLATVLVMSISGSSTAVFKLPTLTITLWACRCHIEINLKKRLSLSLRVQTVPWWYVVPRHQWQAFHVLLVFYITFLTEKNWQQHQYSPCLIAIELTSDVVMGRAKLEVETLILTFAVVTA